MEKMEIQASNIKCDGCVNNIQSGLRELDEVSSVMVDITSNKVTVTGEFLDKAAIATILAELGYPAT